MGGAASSRDRQPPLGQGLSFVVCPAEGAAALL